MEPFTFSTGDQFTDLFVNECPWDGAPSAGYSAFYLDECCDGVNLDVIYTPSMNSLCPVETVASVSYSCADFCGCLDWAACNYDSSALVDDVKTCVITNHVVPNQRLVISGPPGGCEYLDVLGICAGNCFLTLMLMASVMALTTA